MRSISISIASASTSRPFEASQRRISIAFDAVPRE